MPALFFTAPSRAGKTYAIKKALADTGASFYGILTYKKARALTQAQNSNSERINDIFIKSLTNDAVFAQAHALTTQNTSYSGTFFSSSQAGFALEALYAGEPHLAAVSRTIFGATTNDNSTAPAQRNGRPRFANIYPEAFDHFADFLGVAAQNAALSPKGVLLIDELGRLENSALLFQSAVLAAIRLPQKTLGVIQKTHTPFLDKLRQNECVTVLEFDDISEGARERMYSAAKEFILS